MSDAPYPGLRPFRRGETDIFFGREAQIDELVDRLADTRFLSVVGPSGSGKSSLVRAGLLDALESGFMASAGAGWHVADMRPGGQPMLRLADALLEISGSERHEHDDAFLKASLERSRHSLVDYLGDEDLLSKNNNLFLLVDQFEELFRFETGRTQEEAETFVALLLTVVEQSELPVYVVITMRSDFIGDCARFRGLPEAVNNAQFLTPRLTREQSQEAIERPARVFGGEVEGALVNRLLNDMGIDPDQLPLMQHALMRMWTLARDRVESREGEPNEAPDGITLTLANYEAAGGLKQALSNHANEAYNELGDQDKEAARILFRLLTEQGADGRDTRRPTDFGTVVKIASAGGLADEGRASIERVVAAFRRPDRSFIMPPAGVPLEDGRVLDISHESLIRQWDRLRDWAREEANAADTYDELLPPAGRWEERQGGLWRALGGLWRGLDLRRARNWRKRVTAEWATLYGGDFRSVERFIRASRNYGVLRWLAVLVTVAAVLGGFVLLQTTHERQRAESALASEEQRTAELFASQLTHASLLARGEDYATAKTVLAQTRDLDDKVGPGRRHARDFLARFAEIMGGSARQVYEGAGAPLLSVAVSPDGKLLAAVGEGGIVVLFDMESGVIRGRLEGHDGDVRDVVFHPQGDWLATGGDHRQIIRWSLPSGETAAKKLQAWEAPGQVWSLAVSPDGELLASGGTDNKVSLWEAETGELIRHLEGHAHTISEEGLAFDPSGKRLASGSYDDTARIWDVATGENLRILRGHNGDVDGVAFSPDGARIVTRGEDHRLILREVESGKLLQVFTGHENYVLGIDFAARLAAAEKEAAWPEGDASLLVSASMDRTLRVWDTSSAVTLRVLEGHTAGVSSIARHAPQDAESGGQVFSASNDGRVRRWDIAPLPHQHLADLPGPGKSAAISPHGQRVTVGFEDGGLRLYTLPEMRLMGEQLDAHEGNVKRLSFNADGTLLASASSDNTAKLWAVSPDGDLTLRQTFRGHTDAVHGLALSPDGATLATASYDGRVGLFTVGAEEAQFFNPFDGKDVNAVSFHPTGDRLLVIGDQDASVWDLTVDPPVQISAFPKSQNMLLWATLSPDGHLMASVGRGYVVEVYSTHDARLQHRLVGHEQTVYRAIFSPDGQQLATVSSDATVRLWDLETGGELFSLRLPTNVAPPDPLWDFDFRCTPAGCWVAVPLVCGKLALYNLGPYAE